MKAVIAALFSCLFMRAYGRECDDLQFQVALIPGLVDQSKLSLLGAFASFEDCASKCFGVESKCTTALFDTRSGQCYQSSIEYECGSTNETSTQLLKQGISTLFCISCPSPTNPLSSSSSMRRKSGSNMLKRSSKVDLRVMTFNTWRMGSAVEHGLHKIAKHVKFVQPDVLGLQEVTNDSQLNSLIDLLKPMYKKCSTSFGKSPILTKHRVVRSFDKSFWWSSGCKIQIPKGRKFNVWNIHLDHKNYQPYVACANKPPKKESLLLKASHELFRTSSLDCTEALELAQKTAASTSDGSIPRDAMRPGGRYEVQGFIMNSSAKTYLRVYVSHVYGPDRFYFQLMENQNLLAVIMDKLQSFYTSPKSGSYKICGDDLVIGLPVASIYQTNEGAIWHRGLVTDIAADRNAAEIFYVDYGTKVIQPIENIKMMRQKFMPQYAQAIRAKLANIGKPDGATEWSKEAITTMINFVSECPLICEVVGMEGNCFSVNLCDTRLPEVDVYLNDFLVTLGLAKKVADNSTKTVVTLSSRSFIEQ